MVFHHAAITYGASGGWYWRERPEGSAPPLTLFVAMNQAWFMGFFFLLAGHFSVPSYQAKAPRRFLADRALRLGVPLLLYALLIDPLANALAAPVPSVGEWARRVGRLPLHPGVMWFVEALLGFSLAYAAGRAAGRWRPRERPLPGNGTLLAAALLVAATSFAVRLAFPTGRSWAGLLPAYFPGYVLLFAAGIAGSPGDWPGRVVTRQAALWGAVSALALAGLIASAFLPLDGSYAGGWSVRAAISALWEPFFAWGVILGLLRLFARHPATATRATSWAGRRAYACYMLHPPILVVFARLLHPWQAAPLAKAATLGTIGCIATLGAASLAITVPPLRRVL